MITATKAKQLEPELLIDCARGIYIPKIFSEMFADLLTGEQKAELSDPENEYYWEVWEQILDGLQLPDDNGVMHTLYQDGDLWAIPPDTEPPTENCLGYNWD